MISDNFLKDTIRQLKSNLECYVFTKEQVHVIVKTYERETGLKLKKRIDESGYYVLIPNKKIYKHKNF